MPMMCSSVDLPAPDGPMIDTNSPSLMSSAMRRSTHVRLAPSAYDFSMFRIDTSASAGPGSDSIGTSTRAGAAAGGAEREKKDMARFYCGRFRFAAAPRWDVHLPGTERARLGVIHRDRAAANRMRQDSSVAVPYSRHRKRG